MAELEVTGTPIARAAARCEAPGLVAFAGRPLDDYEIDNFIEAHREAVETARAAASDAARGRTAAPASSTCPRARAPSP
jgi:hypothetical protein